MNIAPRKSFIANESARLRHAATFASPEMQEWLTIAFAEYAISLPPSRGAQEGMDANSRRDGAREFIAVLMSLSSQTTPAPRTSDNLPHLP